MNGAKLRTIVAMAMVIAFVSAMFAGASGIRAEDAPADTATSTEVATETVTPDEPTATPTEPVETETATPTEPAEETVAPTDVATEEATPAETATASFSAATINDCSGLSSVHTTDLATWDLTQTRSGGHNELVAGGLHVWTDSNTTNDKAAGYYTTDFGLADVGNPSIEFADGASGGLPGLQLGVDKDNDGSWDGYLVYEPAAYGEGTWWSLRDFGIGGAGDYLTWGTLDQILTANPEARVTSIGYSLGSGVLGDVVITKIIAGCVEYTFSAPPPPTVNDCSGLTSVHTTDLSTWDLSQTRTSGHNELVAGGLHVWTDSNTGEDKAAAYYATNFALQDAGVPSIAFSSYTDGRPSLQLGVDKDNNGTWDGYLVYEPWAYEDGKFWSNKDFGITPGMGYPSYGTLNDYLAANPDARVTSIGYSLGSGLKGDAVITSIIAGCVEYTFSAPPPKPRIYVTPNAVTPGQSVNVSVTDFDPTDSVLIRWKIGSSWVAVGTVTTDATGAGATTVTVPSNVAAGANSVRGDGATKAQQTNAVTVTIPGPPSVTLSTTRATVNSTITFDAANFAPNSSIAISWKRPGGSVVDLGSAAVGADGTATGAIVVPASEGGDGNRVIFTGSNGTVVVVFDVAPRIKVTPGTVSPGDSVDVSLRGYAKKETVQIRWKVNGVWVTVATVTTSNTGSANVTVQVPANANAGQNSVRGDGTVFRQQTNAVTVEP